MPLLLLRAADEGAVVAARRSRSARRRTATLHSTEPGTDVADLAFLRSLRLARIADDHLRIADLLRQLEIPLLELAGSRLLVDGLEDAVSFP